MLGHKANRSGRIRVWMKLSVVAAIVAAASVWLAASVDRVRTAAQRTDDL